MEPSGKNEQELKKKRQNADESFKKLVGEGRKKIREWLESNAYSVRSLRSKMSVNSPK